MFRRSHKIYATLPLRDIVMFPGMVAPLFVGREKSVRALASVIDAKKEVLLVSQRNGSKDDPKFSDIYKVGVLAEVLQLLKLPDGTVKVLVEAKKRVKITKFVDDENYYQVAAEEIEDREDYTVETEALMRTVIKQVDQYVQLNKKINPDIAITISAINSPSKLADTVASHLMLKIADKQSVLEITRADERLERIIELIEREIGVLGAEKKVRSRVKEQMEKTQKDYYLNEQMKAIQKELGDEDAKTELDELGKSIKKTKLSKEANEKLTSELKKLKAMNPISAEASIVRNYIETVLGFPWGKFSKSNSDIKNAQKVLDQDHYGLDKAKERIIEHLAVQHRMKKMKGPILCLVGPPGVGKTSMARSIADATGREFSRFSLGGIRDEAEIRGHRRTYVGALPGKILQLLKKAKNTNPVMLLDEVDKMGHDYRGDPASALLEVLDPEQNDKFVDHYAEVEYDLSHIMFIATANTLDLPRPLLDRMEIIRLSGYTEDEKLEIALKHLLPKQVKEHGLKKEEFKLSDAAVKDIIRYYTREAGVRGLEKEIAKLCRKAVKQIIDNPKKQVNITSKNVNKFLGVRKFDYGRAESKDLVGVSTGLAYTEVGGELLSIEAVVLPGKGEIKATGKLGEVMQESAQAAFSYFKSRSLEFGVTPPQFLKKNIHLHVPEGATPKDGPSAGIAMLTAVVSAMTGVPIKKTIAMTGEITLRGRVLAIGGLKEKLLAALRGGIKMVLIPAENEKDLSEIPENVTRDLEIIPVAHADDVLKIALTKKLKPCSWNEGDDKILPISKDNSSKDVVTH
jgi:ATP-dependent Lon protease